MCSHDAPDGDSTPKQTIRLFCCLQDSCGSLVGDNSQTALGMRGFVKQTLGLGFDSQRLHLQQRLVNEEGKAVPASIRLMQENARLIVLTKEVTRPLLPLGAFPGANG